jgi:hypothetical protein
VAYSALLTGASAARNADTHDVDRGFVRPAADLPYPKRPAWNGEHPWRGVHMNMVRA